MTDQECERLLQLLTLFAEADNFGRGRPGFLASLTGAEIVAMIGDSGLCTDAAADSLRVLARFARTTR